jgi:sugar phosphate isomerase/epimerase
VAEKGHIVAKIPVGLQLYSVRDQLKEDFQGTVRAVAQMGYAGVELAGYGGLNAKELRALLDGLGLQVAGDHVGFDRLEHQMDDVIVFSKELGTTYVVCPAVPAARRQDAAGWKQLAGTLNEIGKKCVDQGLQFCYHNHNFEFASVDGSNGFTLLYANSDPRYVKMELDMYWAQKGGDNPAAILQRYPGRCPIVHLKDMTGDAEQTFAEVGEGVLNFQQVFAAAATGGVAWYVVEQDRCRRPPLESVQLSLQHLREWGMV